MGGGQGSALSPTRQRLRSLLDPYRAEIDGLLGEGVWNAVVTFRELQIRAFPGEISIVRDYIRPNELGYLPLSCEEASLFVRLLVRGTNAAA